MDGIAWLRHCPLTQAQYMRWAVEPESLDGEGIDEVFSEYLPIDPPAPSGLGVFSVPGVDLSIENGGDLTAAVEFWDDDDKLSEADIHNLAAIDPPIFYDDYGLFTSASAATTEEGDTGTFYGSWKTCGPIAPGEGFLIGNGAGGYGRLLSTVYWGYYGDKNGSAACVGYLQLADEDHNVILEIPIVSLNFVYSDYTSDIQSEALAEDVKLVSWETAVRYARVRLDVNSAIGTTSSFLMENMTIRRVHT